MHRQLERDACQRRCARAIHGEFMLSDDSL
jgi:hypothetical protein